MSDKQVRAKYTREYKLEAVRQFKAGQSIAATAKVLGIPKATAVLPERGVLCIGCRSVSEVKESKTKETAS